MHNISDIFPSPKLNRRHTFVSEGVDSTGGVGALGRYPYCRLPSFITDDPADTAGLFVVLSLLFLVPKIEPPGFSLKISVGLTRSPEKVYFLFSTPGVAVME